MSQALNRRTFFTGTASALAGAVIARDYGPNAPLVRYPDPDIVSLDPSFGKYKLGNTAIKRVAHGYYWAEGPAWNGVGKYLIWSDIPSNKQFRYLDGDGHVSMFRHPSNNSNGNTFDWSGRQISCEHGTRRVVRYEYNGSTTVLADRFEGKGFNAPNDAVVHPNGDIWFTDPGYGSLMNYEGNRAGTGSVQPYRKEAVYRIDSKTGGLHRVTDEIYKPNGLCFSPDYKKLYIADTGSSHYPAAEKEIKVWDVVDASKLAKGKTFASMKLEVEGEVLAGQVDGIRADTDGNIWASAGWVGEGYDGVHIFNPGGQRIGQIKLPEICSNLCFGGPKRNRLFMTASQSVYAVYVETQGAHIA